MFVFCCCCVVDVFIFIFRLFFSLSVNVDSNRIKHIHQHFPVTGEHIGKFEMGYSDCVDIKAYLKYLKLDSYMY